jgi:hypothetical protein
LKAVRAWTVVEVWKDLIMLRAILIGLAMMPLASCIRTVEPTAEERLEIDAGQEIEKME